MSAGECHGCGKPGELEPVRLSAPVRGTEIAKLCRACIRRLEDAQAPDLPTRKDRPQEAKMTEWRQGIEVRLDARRPTPVDHIAAKRGDLRRDRR